MSVPAIQFHRLPPFILVDGQWGSNPVFNQRPPFPCTSETQHVDVNGSLPAYTEIILELVKGLSSVCFHPYFLSRDISKYCKWSNGNLSFFPQISRSSMRWRCWTPKRAASRSWKRSTTWLTSGSKQARASPPRCYNMPAQQRWAWWDLRVVGIEI